ncbi:MAG: Ig-like domain-containing protein [FCB group bacterium]|nr:Ig-like domain-containing protein [FCB group bacterium]
MGVLARFSLSRVFLAQLIVLCGALPGGAFAGNDNTVDPGAPPPRAPHLRYQVAPDLGGAHTKLAQPVDVVFAIDNTGSMGGVIDTLKADAITIAAQVREQFSNTAFGAIKFKDYGYDSDYVTEIATPITLDISLFNAGIAGMGTHGGAGGDWPEAFVEAVLQGVEEIRWRHDAVRLLVVVGDAPPHDPIYGTGVSGSGHTWAEAASTAANAGVVVSMVAVGYGIEDPIVYRSYNDMTTATGGVYVESSQPSEVTNALIALILSLSDRKPTVESITPAHNARNVRLDAAIEAGFNMDMDALSFTSGTVYMDAGAFCVPVQLYYDFWNRKIQITPLIPLEKGQRYSIMLGNGIRSAYDEELADYEWSFTTVSDPPATRIRTNIESFARTCELSLDAQKGIATGLVTRAAGRLSDDELFTLTRDLVNLAIDWRDSGIVRALDFNHANGLSNGLATLVTSARQIDNMSDEMRARLVQKTANHATELLSRRGSLGNTEAVNEWLESGLVLLDNDNYSHSGVKYFRERLEALRNAALASVTDSITPEQADAVVKFLQEQRVMAARAATREVLARWSNWDGTCRLESGRPLGHMASYTGELEAAIACLSAPDGAKATVAVTKGTGPILKAGGMGAYFTGAGASAGAGSFALGEKLYWGPDSLTWNWDMTTREAATINVPLSARDCVKHVLFESVDSLEDEGWLWVDFVNNSFEEVKRLLATAKQGDADTWFAKAAAAPAEIRALVAPNVNSGDVASSTTLTVRNNGSNPLRCTATGLIYGPDSISGELPLASIIGSRNPLNLSAGATGSFALSAPGFPLALSGLQGCRLTMTVWATDVVTGKSWTVGPATTTFHMVTPEEASYISSVKSQTILSGTVTPGDRQEITFSIPSGTSTAMLTLFTCGPNRADLHAFNAASNHTGMDYVAEAPETDIPGSTYQESDAETESIVVSKPAAGEYTARVVGREGSVRFVLQLVTTGLNAPVPAAVMPISAGTHPGATARTSIFIREIGGYSNITNLALELRGGLIGPGGETIPQKSMVLGAYSAVVPKGQTVAVPLSITVAAHMPPGDYTGEILFTAAKIQKSIPVKLKVGVNMPSCAGMTCLAAEAALRRAGLIVGARIVVYDPSLRAGTIIGQNPPAGTDIAPGTEVRLIVSTDKKIDVDASGLVDARDVQLVINAVLGRDIGSCSADLNGDNVVNAKDVQLVNNAVLGRF